jgi:hypothetical protein
MGFQELVDCPIVALHGLNDVQALKEGSGVDTIRELADNRFVRVARVTSALSG